MGWAENEVGAAGEGDSEREKKGEKSCLLRHYGRIVVFFFVLWKLRSSEPCGCTLTLRDRFLSLSVLLRVMNKQMGVVHAVVLKRGRGRGTEHKWKLTNIVGCCFLLEETNWSWAKR